MPHVVELACQSVYSLPRRVRVSHANRHPRTRTQVLPHGGPPLAARVCQECQLVNLKGLLSSLVCPIGPGLVVAGADFQEVGLAVTGADRGQPGLGEMIEGAAGRLGLFDCPAARRDWTASGMGIVLLEQQDCDNEQRR